MSSEDLSIQASIAAFDGKGTAELPDLLPGGSAVAGEAGTLSGQSGQYAPHVEAEGCRLPASQQAAQRRAEVLTFELTEGQRAALAFAALCEAEALEEGDEADDLEVQQAICDLREARSVLNGRPS